MAHRILALATATLAVAAAQTTVDNDQVLFGDLPKIEAATLHAQTLAEAPANVTVITADQIRRYGYRTLAEALAAVRGFYATYDHSYHYVGVSGVSLPGDFNTRFLVMLNGHPLTENIYNSNGFFGQDFGLDMDLVERIEIIRGPTSAIYGSNGMLANINVVTRSPVDGEPLRVSTETDSSGERKLAISSSTYLGHGANLLVSASVFNNGGQSFPSAGVPTPPGTGSDVADADGERGYHTFANLIWHNWTFTGFFNSRDKQPPIGLGTSYSLDPGQHLVDGRGLAGAVYKRQAGPGTVQWQVFYDRYRYHDRFDYPGSDGVQDVRDFNYGDWMDSQLTYALPVAHVGTLTAGMEGSWDLQSRQYNLAGGVREDMVDRPDRSAAVFAQQEWNLSSKWSLTGGLRLDESRNYGHFVSPRLALVFQSSPRTAYKLVYGRPFRNPSAFERYYNDGGLSYAAAPPLRQEVAQTFQASVERVVAPGWTLIAEAFQYRMDRVIQAVTLDNGAQQYNNAGAVHSTGGELELNGKLSQGWEVSGSVAIQQAAYGQGGGWLANSPRQVAKARLGYDLFRQRVLLAGAARFLSARLSEDGDRLGGFLLADFTATARLAPRFDIQAGVRNAFDRRYEDPINCTVDRLRGDGRSLFVKLVWRAWE